MKSTDTVAHAASKMAWQLSLCTHRQPYAHGHVRMCRASHFWQNSGLLPSSSSSCVCACAVSSIHDTVARSVSVMAAVGAIQARHVTVCAWLHAIVCLDLRKMVSLS